MTPPDLEFTGERLVPGKVDRELLAEHVARYQLAVKQLQELPFGASVLDLASGAGYGTQMLAEAGFAAIGIDISAEAVAWATEQFADATDPQAPSYQVSDAGAIALPAASRQGIVAFEILEHLENPEGMLRELARILAPDGIALISTPNPAAHRIAGENHYHFHEYTVSEMNALMEQYFPGWPYELVGQRQEGVGGSSALTGLRKAYIGLKRKVGLGPLIPKPNAPWNPGTSLLEYPHPYAFSNERCESAEYIIAVLRRPSAPS